MKLDTLIWLSLESWMQICIFALCLVKYYAADVAFFFVESAIEELYQSIKNIDCNSTIGLFLKKSSML